MKPILFNTEMVKAILDGRKTVTRRVIKPQPLCKLSFRIAGYQAREWGYPAKDAWKQWEDKEYRLPENITEAEQDRVWNPPCHADDILYVRETWANIPETAPGNLHFKASASEKDLEWFKENGWKWRPSIHMPKEAARLFLRVKSVRVERLQDITISQIVAEGAWEDCIECLSCYSSTGIQCCIGGEDECSVADSAFEGWRNLWNGTIKTADLPKYGWDANPWVWVAEFERCEKPEATP